MTNKSTLAQRLSHAWPWTKPIGSSPTASRLLRYSLLCMLVLLCGGSAWADSVVLSTPAESVVTHSDANGIITIADETSKTGIQQGSGSYKISDGSESYIPMKLSGSRQFNLTFSNDVTITKATLYATSNDNSKTATLGTSSSDRTSLGTMPVRGSENPLVVDLLTNNITGLNASSQFLAIIVVEYSTSAPSLSVSPKTLSLALNPSKQESVENFTLTGKNLTNGEYSLTIPNLAGLEVNPSSFTVTDGQVNQVFTVKYATTTDVAKATANITATVGELTATVSVTYQSRATAYTQSTVSAEATWDWTKLTETAELTDDTTPSKSDEFLLADLDDRITFNEAFGDPTAIMMSGMQYPSRSGFAQGTTIKFKTSVPGTISVDFSNTGGDDRPDRYLNVNGKNTEFKSNSTTKVSATDIAVPAGEVVLMGNMVDADADGGFSPNQLRWYKITFTPGEEPVEEPTEKTWQQATSIAVGDVVLITNTDASKELKEIGSNNIGVVDAYESKPAGLLPLTVVAGSSTASASYAFQTKDGKYLAWLSGNTLTTSDEINANSSWMVTFTEEGVPTILNVADNSRKLQYNSGSPRFCAYATNQQPVTFWKQVEVAADTRTATTLTIAEAPTTGETGTTIALPTATVTAGEAEVSGATVTWTSDNEEVAKIEGSNINLLKAGTAKITASYAGDDTYKESTANFTLTVTDAPYKTLKALQAAVTDASTPANISLSNVQVVFVNGSNAYLTDADGYGVLIYTNGHGLEVGQVLNGTISCKFILYQGNTEITNFSKEGLTITNADVTPVERTLPLTTANQSTLVTLKNLTYNADAKTLSDGTNTITFYDKFKTDVTLEDGKTYDVTGIVVMYNTTNNSTIEICPRTADDVVVAAAPAGDTYVVAGGFKDSNEQWTEGCFGTQWAPKLVDNQLVKQDNGTYSKTYENVKIAEKTTIEYKICTNGQYPDGDNKWYYFEKAGTYDITFTYDPNATEGDGITMTATLKYESVYAVGDGLGSLTDWSFADGNKLTESTETPGVYSITYNNVPASEAVFKFALDGKWDHNFGGTKDGNNAFSATIGTVYDAVYDGANISITTTETSNITLTLDLSNFDFNTKQGAKFTITSEAVEEPAGDVTATWDFRGETPTPATLTKVNVESKATYYPSNNAIAALYVNALNGKLAYNSSGYAQFNAGTILRVPVYTTDDVVTVTAFPGQYKYTIGGSAATADETVHTATAEEVSKGYVEIVATDGAYLYAITMKTTQTAAKHAVWNFLNEIPTTITGTEINLTTGNVASSVEGIALDVNGYLKARGTDGWIKTNTTMNVPVKTEGDIVTVMAYSTQYDNYTVGGKDASNNESPIYTYKATTTDATNGYVTIATSDQQAYIYAISVQQLPVKEPTTLDNEPATVTFPFNLGIEGQKATFSNEDYWLNSKVEVGGNMGYANTRTLGDVTFTKIQPQTAAASAAAEDYVLFRVQPKPGFTFTPTAVSLKAYKDGTDNGKLTIKWVADGTEYTLDTDKAIARNSETPAFSSLEYNDFTSVTPLEGYCGLKVYIGGNLGTTKQVGLSDIIIEGTLSGTEQELPILASFKVNETEYAVEDVFGDGYEATLELSKTETIVSGSNPLTEITATSGEVGNVVYADATESSCKVTIPVTAGNTTLDYVLNVVHKPDFTLTYYNVSGEEIGTQTVEKDAKIGEFAYNIANVEASKEGYKARGWFKNNYVGEKWTTESTITADAKLYAVETEIEVSSDSKKYVFDLTDKNFDANDHEAFNPTGGAWHDNQHGWVFANDDKIELLVGKKATITIGLCKYSEAGSTISAPNDENISAVVETCGSTGAIEYEGDAGTLTLTIHSTGSVYIHSIKIMNTTTTNYEVNGDWIIVKEGDASSLVDAIEAAKEGARIFLPNGTYDLGQKTLTTVGSNNVSIIGESMDGVIIKNRPTAEGISTTATLLNSSTGLYMQDLTLQNDWDYYNGGADGRAVCIQDKGTQTICKNVTLLSYQDTYYTNNANGEYYWETSNIHGTVDFICGEGTLFMEKSTLTVEKRKADGSGECTITAPSTAAGKEVGYVFNNCKIENSAASFNLGRAWNNEPRCAFINPTYNDTKLIANRWTLKGMNVVAKEFVEYNPSDGKTENNVTFTYGTTSNTMNTIISDADKFSIDKVFTGWAPNDIATQIKAPVAELKNGVITWEKVNGATAYAIFKDGEFLGITTENTWTVEEEAAPAPRRTGEEAEATTTGYTIRAANSRGGFGEPAEVSPATGINATLNDSTKDSVIYDLNGRRVMTPTKGVYIINGKKVVIK